VQGSTDGQAHDRDGCTHTECVFVHDAESGVRESGGGARCEWLWGEKLAVSDGNHSLTCTFQIRSLRALCVFSAVYLWIP